MPGWDLSALLDEQRGLDAAIFRKGGQSYASSAAMRRLALAVELGELANALRFFKFWSLRRTGDRGQALEEFADVLHFALTFCAQHGADASFGPARAARPAAAPALTRRFLALYALAAKVNSKRGARAFLRALLALAGALGFARGEVLAAYRAKHEKNEARAAGGY